MEPSSQKRREADVKPTTPWEFGEGNRGQREAASFQRKREAQERAKIEAEKAAEPTNESKETD